MATETIMDTSAPIASNTTASKPDRPSVTTSTPTPHTYDLGNLLLHDPNPLPPRPSPTDLSNTARTCAQSLINQLLTTCLLHTSPTDGVLLTLPAAATSLPREKPLPKAKPETKWEQFAKKKGIKDKKRGEGKMVFDEASGEWMPKWGYKGKGREGEDWLVEVDEKEGKGDEEGKGRRGEGRRDRVEKVRRSERMQRANERKGRKGWSG